MRHYTQHTMHQRYQIYGLMKAGHNQTEITDACALLIRSRDFCG